MPKTAAGYTATLRPANAVLLVPVQLNNAISPTTTRMTRAKEIVKGPAVFRRRAKRDRQLVLQTAPGVLRL